MCRYLILVVLAGCASASPPEPGPQGEQGIQGPRGQDGLTGPMGPVGPTGASAIRVQPLPAGTLCATGGVLLSDADGGSSALCNGSTGNAGAVGAAGATGAQGPMGLTPPSLVVRDTSGGVLGPVYATSANTADFVYMESLGCVAQIDYAKNMIRPIQTSIYYTQANCTGIAFTRMNNNTIFPVGCLAVGNNNAFKFQNPVLAQTIVGQSVFQPLQFLPDGGITTTCDPQVSSAMGAVVEPLTFPSTAGPFSFGTR